jgi:predicted MFS family arabinose efflux permease
MARELKDDYRRGIITITLFGGLASTVFIPLTHMLTDALGWRHALQILALLQIPFGVAIHWLSMKNGASPHQSLKPVVPRGRVKRAMAQPVFWFLALSYAAHAFMFTGVTFHIIPMLIERGFAVPVIIGAYAIVGPCQVMGRMVVFALERKIDARIAGLAGTSLPVIGMLLLLLATPGSPLLYAFAVLYGGGMGIKTIVQATAGPEFLGREGYGALQGTFAGINYIVQAATPFALALLWSMMGSYDYVLWILFAAAFASAAAFVMALVLRSRSYATTIELV